MKLIDPTDNQIERVFATEVAGWKHRIATLEKPIERCGMRLPNSFGHPIEAWWHETDEAHLGVYASPPRFTRSADAVLPWLEKSPFDFHILYVQTTCMWHVRLEGRFTSNKEFKEKSDENMAKAACIALLLAHGVEVEFTK